MTRCRFTAVPGLGVAGDSWELHRAGVGVPDACGPVQQTVGAGQWRHHYPGQLLARLSTKDLRVRPED
jgi:hypothetical protein